MKYNTSTNATGFRESLTVKFYGDIKIRKPPTDLFGGLELYRELPNMVTRQNAVAQRIYLTPLSMLTSKAAKLFGKVSDKLVKEVCTLRRIIH